MSETLSPDVRAYMSALGKKSSAAKAAAARQNVVKAAAARRRDANELPCLCGGCPDNPKSTCPRGRLLRQRARSQAQRANSETAAQDAKDGAQ